MAGSMRFEDFSFGALQIDGVTDDYDVVIDRGELRKRKKTASKPFREAYGHTPISIDENISWKASGQVSAPAREPRVKPKMTAGAGQIC
jgi:hypothetical protein